MAKFQKGQSGNPAGRPKGKTAREILREALAKQNEDGRTRLEQWAEDLATTPNLPGRLEVLRWLEGTNPPQSTTVELMMPAEGIRIPAYDDRFEEPAG